MVVFIDEVRCHGVHSCPAKGVCVDACALNVISIYTLVEGRVRVSDGCTDCGMCVMNCPLEAIRLPE